LIIECAFRQTEAARFAAAKSVFFDRQVNILAHKRTTATSQYVNPANGRRHFNRRHKWMPDSRAESGPVKRLCICARSISKESPCPIDESLRACDHDIHYAATHPPLDQVSGTELFSEHSELRQWLWRQKSGGRHRLMRALVLLLPPLVCEGHRSSGFLVEETTGNLSRHYARCSDLSDHASSDNLARRPPLANLGYRTPAPRAYMRESRGTLSRRSFGGALDRSPDLGCLPANASLLCSRVLRRCQGAYVMLATCP
jgi:hypothetical protein